MQKILQKQENLELILRGYNSLIVNPLKGTSSEKGDDMPIKLIKGSIRYREDLKVFEARVCINYKTRSFYDKNKNDCIKKANAYYRANYKKIYIEDSKDKMKFVDWLDTWFEVYKKPSLKKSSLPTIQSAIKKHIKPFFEKETLKNITALKIDTFLNTLGNSRRKETVSTILGDCLSTAYRKELIKKPLHQQMTKYKHERQEGHCLTEGEEEILFENLPKVQNSEIIYFVYLTGCRRHGALNLLSQDIDFENKTIHIRETKTKTSDRYIAITPRIEQFLQSLDLSKEKVFDLSDRQFKKMINEISNLCKFRVHLKDLRTTFATRAREKGVAAEVLKKWLGHKNYNVTEKYYVKITDDFEKKQIELLD